MSSLKRRLLYVMAGAYVIAGAMHFIKPAAYVALVPPALPFKLALVYISGVAEIALGLALLAPNLRRLADLHENISKKESELAKLRREYATLKKKL